MNTITKLRLTRQQRAALAAYEFAERQEDRYLGSVFVTSTGQRDSAERTCTAYELCKSLGMGADHGL